MQTGKRLSEKIKCFFQEEVTSNEIEVMDLHILDSDGAFIFSYKSSSVDSGFGVLTLSIWQAFNELRKLQKIQKEQNQFNLSFQTSDTGFYIFPFNWEGRSYYACSIYESQLNPGQLKFRLNKIIQNLTKFLNQERETEKVNIQRKDIEKKEEKDKKLFQNITDEEIDQLFGPVGI